MSRKMEMSGMAQSILLSCCEYLDGVLYIRAGQLDRKMYEEVNKVLEAAGGKWDKRKKGHVFESDPTELVAEFVRTGILPEKNPLDYFPTPPELAASLLVFGSCGWDGGVFRVLEPSAGRGALLTALVNDPDFEDRDLEITAYELDEKHADHLERHFGGAKVQEADFLTVDPKPVFNLVYMNPPFTSEKDPLAYMTHIAHAFKFLKRGGELIAITPPNWQYREDRRCRAFKAFVEQYGEHEDNPEGSFKASGTGVATTTIYIKRGEA